MDIEKLLISIPPIESRFTSEIYKEIVSVIIAEVNKTPDPEDTFSPYVYPIENIQRIAESDNIEYKEGIRDMADNVWNQEDWLNAILVYYILMHIISFLPTDFYKLAYALGKLNYNDLAENLINIYEQISTNKKVTCHAIANFYYTAVDMPFKAKAYFEKYLEFDPENPNIYLTLSHIYSRIDDETSREKQLNALKKAYELNPNDATVVKALLTAYEKRHDDEKVKEFYPKLLDLAHTPRHSMNYGLYLMGWGEFCKGGKYFVERFDLDDYPIGYPKGVLNLNNKWNFKDDISDKLLLVHYEEGFGDSIMYSRFIPIIKQIAGRVAFVIQPELLKLFSQSPLISEGIELFSDLKEFMVKYKNEKFLHTPLLDLPYAIGLDKSFIPYSKSYINSDKPKKYDNSKFNIGISYSGDSKANYEIRDVSLDNFIDLSKLPNVQLYSLQVGDSAEQLKSLPKDVNIVDLGKGFKDFTDTANAIEGLDLVITTDNVILNLAGAMGKKTFGIFNKYPNFRWFNLKGEDVIWYKSVKPFQTTVENDWSSVFKSIEQAVLELDKQK